MWRRVSGNYDAVIDLRNGVALSCTCSDWQSRGQTAFRPCKHLLALALEADAVAMPTAVPLPAVAPTVSPVEPSAPNGALPDFTPQESFGERVIASIGRAIAALADLVEVTLRAGEIPFLVGPTGSGKTSAVRLVGVRNGWGFEDVTGSESWADADLLGLRTDHQEQPGVFARAFARAREGETVLLCIDEVTRFNSRAHDLFLRPFQATPAVVA
jgi:hypothetical protein